MNRILLNIFLFLIFSTIAFSDDSIEQQIKADLIENMEIDNYQMGYKYILAFPPNEAETHQSDDNALQIYVSSNVFTNLDINIFGTSVKESVLANGYLVIDDKMGLDEEIAEVRTPNTTSNKTITIKADNPISVYVMNSRSTSTDGYMAIPVENWGREYLHCSYYDNYEDDTRKFPGGFLVLGSEDKTRVNVDLRGVGSSQIATLKGRAESIGDKITFLIDEGEVYQIEGDGLTKGEFDISGTLITSDKPVGLISYHTRTSLPIFAPDSRDHLCEMIPPTSALGSKYASISMDRNGSKKGDLFRIVAVEDNTNFSATWYELESDALINDIHGILDHAGDFEDISSALTPDANINSITGASIFESDKPILLMQYSYSDSWDNSGFDPCMTVVPPLDQYVTHALINAPANKAFKDNYLTIIAIHDPNDEEMSDLKSIILDNTKLIDIVPSFTQNQIPGTDLYWARVEVNNNTYTLKGNGVKFAGYMYGHKSVDTYAWPTAMASKPLDKIDTLAPKVTYKNSYTQEGIWNIRVQEDRYYNNDDKIFEDSKVWNKPFTMLYGEYGLNTYNFKQPTLKSSWHDDSKGNDDYEFTIQVLDKNEKAEANFYIVDKAGNITLGKVQYFPNTIQLNNPLDTMFGKIHVNTSKKNTLVFTNNSGTDYNIMAVSLIGRECFKLQNAEFPIKVKDGATYSFDVIYAPTEIMKNDITELYIITENLEHKWSLRGRSLSDVETFERVVSNVLSFGTVPINKTRQLEVEFINDGLEDINIQKISMKEGSIFSTSNEHNSSTMSIDQKIKVTLEYSPKVVSDYDIDSLIVKTSNAVYAYPVFGKADDKESVFEANSNIIRVSPNPIQSEANVTVNLTQASNLTAKIYGMEGQLVATIFDGMCNKGEKSIKMDASNLASGSYTLVVELGNKKYASQIVISK